jgi:hypothetical protein
MKFHPVCELFPTMSDEELQALADDIRQNGQIHPILTYNGDIIDGKNRWLACERHNITPRIQEWKPVNPDQSLVTLVLSLNLKRRQLTSEQRAIIAVESLPLYEAEAAARQKAQGEHGKEGGRGKTKTLTQQIGEGFTGQAKEPDSSTQQAGESKRHEGEAVAQAAKAAGTNRESVRRAKKMKKEEPERYEQAKRNMGKKREAKQAIRRERATSRGNGRSDGHKPAPAKPATVSNSQRRFQERHIGYIDACVKAARPLSVADIAKITGLKENNIGKNSVLQYWTLVPWLRITCTSRPPFRYSFEVDQYVRTVCEGRAPLPSLGLQSILNSLAALRKEIDRRREEAQAKRIEKQWNPTAVRSYELIKLVDYIEQQLDSLNAL